MKAGWIAVAALSLAAGGVGGFGAAELSRPTSARATSSSSAPSNQEVRQELDLMHAVEAQARLDTRMQRLDGCMPELMHYINALTNGLDAAKALTGACVTLFYPEGLPLN